MGLMDNITGSADRLADTIGSDPQSAASGRAFKRDFNISNFDSFGGDVTSGKYTEVARFNVPASTEYSWGYGRAHNPENQGYLYVDLQNSTPAAVDGTIRFTIQSATGRQEEVVADFDTSTLDASKTDRTQQVPFPEQVDKPVASEDSHLVVKLDPSANDTIDSANSEVILPVTEYDLS